MAASKKEADPATLKMPPVLFEALAQFLETHSPIALLVAWSGGRDSTVLLHALHQLRPFYDFRLRAVHVNHQLQPAADLWADQCLALAASWNILCEVKTVEVVRARRGLEAAAREARYAVLAQCAQADEWVVTAHHQRDQAETVLLNLARGGGVRGLQGMRPLRPLAGTDTMLARPLLEVAPEVLAQYAVEHGLKWVEDPHNEDPAFLRSRVRHEWLPCMRDAVPHVETHLARSAHWQQEALDILQTWAEETLAQCPHGHDWLELGPLLHWPEGHRKWLLQYWFEKQYGIRLNHNQLMQLLGWPSLRPDAQAVLKVGREEARLFQQRLYFPVVIPEWRRTRWVERAGLPFEIRQREPTSDAGETSHVRDEWELVPLGMLDWPRRRFKKAFQQAAVPPWLRSVWPVLLDAAGRGREVLGISRLDGAGPPRFSVHFIAGCGGID